MLRQVEACYLQMAYHIASQEQLLVVTPEPGRIETLLRQHLPERLMANVSLVCCESDDTWARDHGPLCVLEGGLWTVKDFGFNAWGGKFPFEKDNAITARVFQNGTWHANYQDCTDFILEGGSVESDGRGTILTTAQCLLNPNRNPRLSAADIEERLLRELHARRVLWLHHGHMDGDDTDAHIDTLARLCPADTIAYVQCTDPDDGHYDDLQHMEAELRNLRTLEDRPYRLLPLPCPLRSMTMTTARGCPPHTPISWCSTAVCSYPPTHNRNWTARPARPFRKPFPPIRSLASTAARSSGSTARSTAAPCSSHAV